MIVSKEDKVIDFGDEDITKEDVKEYVKKLNNLKEDIDFVLMYDDIKDETKEKIIAGEFYELYWDDFTEDFQTRFLDHYGDNGNYDVIPLMICLDQFMIDGSVPVFEWAKVDYSWENNRR